MLSSLELIDIIQCSIDEQAYLDARSPLIGGDSLIDSMGLVQICLALEEKSQLEGFLFDWTSEKAMSSLHSIFKTPESLTEEYNRQFIESKK